jgi:hypothetical protein
VAAVWGGATPSPWVGDHRPGPRESTPHYPGSPERSLNDRGPPSVTAAAAVAATAAASLVLPTSAAAWLIAIGTVGFAGALVLNPNSPWGGRTSTA